MGAGRERNEQQLVTAAQNGEQAAFEDLVNAYQSMLFNAAYRILSDEEAAADAAQEALMSAYRAIATFRGGSFKAWMLRIVTNASYDQLRRKQRRPTSSLEALMVGPGTHGAFTAKTENPESYVLRQDLGRTLQRGLDMLSLDQRTAVVLSDIHGLSYPEIAEIADVPIGTVKSRISRGRARLRDYLLKQEGLTPRHYLHAERLAV
ncbi:MAG: sigma-70 family RNA polymerase sigma factor, partial [Anaerolineae bacterium]